jgi:hypothetical protein
MLRIIPSRNLSALQSIKLSRDSIDECVSNQKMSYAAEYGYHI